jgi:hypothetical protein
MVARLKLQFRARRVQAILVDWSREVVDNLVKEVCGEGRKRVTWRVESILTCVGPQQKLVRQKVWAKGKNGLYGWRMAEAKKQESEFKPFQSISSNIQKLSRNAHNSVLENNTSKNISKL